MLHVKSLEETLAILRAEFPPADIGVETVPLAHAAGRVLAQDIAAREDNPPYTRSSLDGYAVRAADTFGASEATPAMLTNALYVPTGGPLPPGTDAVAMIEIAEKLGEYTLISNSVAPGTGVVYQGEDAKKGEVILRAGQGLSPRQIGALAALGYAEVAVKKRLRCGIISTGDELVPIESQGIRDVNNHMLRAQAEAFGCEAHLYGICPDDEEKLFSAIRQAHAECDVVLVSGGSSVGVMDFTRRIFEKLGRVLIHGIAMKPGKPTIVAKAEGKALIGLPGHPVSAFFVMLEVVRFLLQEKTTQRPAIMATLAENIPSNHGREDFIPVRLNDGMAEIVPYKSGLIALLAHSDGYIRIPRLTEGLERGAQVQVYTYEA
ncbi:MAG: molybdopterin molybdotransferase MoeA [Clostridia bacterium]|nr:molybdopterin molybdotransferase MoeA [Clostridia bacterium]